MFARSHPTYLSEGVSRGQRSGTEQIDPGPLCAYYFDVLKWFASSYDSFISSDASCDVIRKLE